MKIIKLAILFVCLGAQPSYAVGSLLRAQKFIEFSNNNFIDFSRKTIKARFLINTNKRAFSTSDDTNIKKTLNSKKFTFSNLEGAPTSLRQAYQIFCEQQNDIGLDCSKRLIQAKPRTDIKVGIVGGGMAGLYCGLLLKSRGVPFHIFEANNRPGGRIFTHRFTEEEDQYFEAGAMRIPQIDDQLPFFQLVSYVNKYSNQQDQIELIPYVLNDSNNYVFVNGARNVDGSPLRFEQVKDHPEDLKFPIPDKHKKKTAPILLTEAIGDFIDLVKKVGPVEALEALKKFDDYSMRSYLIREKGWDSSMVNYVETMTAQTHQFDHSFTEVVIEYVDFEGANWKTIKNGMSRLPHACRKLIQDENIFMGANVHKIEDTEDNKVAIHYNHLGVQKRDIFDKVILALPPGVIRMLQKPLWSIEKEEAIRCMHFEPLYKIGLRFKSRFWEKGAYPSSGGQSITDLPSRWIVYPSYGRGTDKPGVLLCYSWMGDALKWLPKSPQEQEELALRDLSQLYGEECIKNEFIPPHSKSVSWATEWALGDAKFLPGQFKSYFNIARNSENNVYFAGEHLSVYHTWILGAIDSALTTSKQVLEDEKLTFLKI